VHTLFGSFLPIAPCPHPLPPYPPSLPSRNYSALISNFVEDKKDISINKKEKVFLLVELRIAIWRDS
jgi:hypothetical protein